MKWEKEILSPAPYLSRANWLIEESKNTKWTPAENKAFENALAVYDDDTPDRWHKVAAIIPGKTVRDVIKQYKELELDVSYIEAGLIPVPGYSTSPFTLDWVNENDYDGFKKSFGLGGKRSSTGRPADQERKKGVPWTEEEHKLFLMGLKKYGKRGLEKHISQFCCQQNADSGGYDARTPSPDNKRPSPDQSGEISQQPNSAAMPRTHFQWNQPSGGGAIAFDSTNANMFMSAPYGINSSYGLKMQGQNPS
ncbi:DUPLICATED HOMEODOMAIN-LIKE SUPERFAMILY PROTEIN-RELATED [Salix purpurea]|uniref:DUPLICATED HOMEODOMAIN-LIKE SUPERFAMILY PROTEIN-RELATED n=1 Tax=Salix purpurea TaxID=77065 RepID=A0A9Q0VVR9_SALPP|nr:DUPLICATED HOMEODOMAIN-LIKE SUPERFAMILY PROTEIN-RELATED [Salix purpurea]